MSIETLMVAALNGHAGVSGLTDGRVYPITLPEKPIYPALVYQLVSRPMAESHPFGKRGPVSADSRYQFDCWARWADGSSFLNGAVALAEAVKAAMVSLMDTSPVDVIIESEMDFNEPEILAFRRVVEVLIVHEVGI